MTSPRRVAKRTGEPKVVSLLVDLPIDSRNLVASVNAVEHAAAAVGVDISVEVVRTDSIDEAFVENPGHGVFMGPGTPFRQPRRAEDVIFSARQRGVPLVGT